MSEFGTTESCVSSFAGYCTVSQDALSPYFGYFTSGAHVLLGLTVAVAVD